MFPFRLLAQVDPVRALHDTWLNTSPEVHLTTGGGGFLGWLAGLNWAAVGSVIAIGIPLAVGMVAQCWRQIMNAVIQVNENRRLSEIRIELARTAAFDQSIPPPPPGAGLRIVSPDVAPNV